MKAKEPGVTQNIPECRQTGLAESPRQPMLVIESGFRAKVDRGRGEGCGQPQRCMSV